MTISKITLAAALAASALVAAPAFAQEEVSDGFSVTGSATVVSDYRFRGISLSDRDATIQGGFGVSHDSGFYVGTWGSGLSGFGSFGGSNTEIDVYGGYTRDLGGLTVDVGLLWYLYPGTDGTDYAEPYASISGDFGPLNAKLGVAYAPDQDAIGSDDNLYVFTDLTAAIPETPLTLKAHYGYTDGSLGGPNGSYSDWSIGASVAWKALTLGVAYVDTSISKSDDFFMDPTRKVAQDGVVFSLGASF
jgi:uncharacterized protein (TIGR02001 family)